ncbi:sulfatase family protein [Pontiella sulfatireligans]|uniref:Arylsulfatase n=1 Tax=Pontiella sulfatireligans TaxID=2750658 RepID=A0A6C2UFE0_9BACT|nr:sulfatase [Pontiella sulfatireligans]SPS74198.1 sulfatase S1_8 [Kiritimatiellales bacterium]VGO18593.1 Arylsulfatase [Pontiella sulfatireligans]
MTRFIALMICFATGVATAESDRPNILFAFADDWGRHAGAYGTDWLKTPTFDRVAEKGILFDQAYTAVAKCAPCRASVLTGRYPWQNEEVGNHLAYWPKDKFQTYIETLVKNGYYAARVGKGWSPGQLPEGRKLCGEIYTGSYVEAFEAFLDDVPEGKPFHFWFCSSDPHRGYKKQKHTAKRLAQIDLPSYWEDTPALRQDVADYAFEVERFDSDTGKMIQLLEERGLLENTLIIMSSDHGMPFPRAKGDTYMAGNHVPLSIMWKGQLKNPGRTCTAYVNFVDIAPTLLELAGVDPKTTGMDSLSGRSWTEIFRGDDLKGSIPERAFALYGRERHDVNIRPDNRGYPSRAIRKGKYLYINNLAPDLPPTALKESGGIAQFKKLDENSNEWKLLYGSRPADEFYNVEEDPECVNNLASNPEYSRLMKSMRSTLHDQLREQNDPRMTGGEVLFDTYPATVPWKEIHQARVQWEKENSKN